MGKIKYRCGACDAIIKKGDSFCCKCGEKLEWPEEKTEKTISMPEQEESKINANAVRSLTNSSVGLSIGVLCCGFGVIIAPILLIQQSDMKKWLYAHDGNKPLSDSIMNDKATSIKNACIWAIMLSILGVVLNILFYIAVSTIYSVVFTGVDAFSWFIYVVITIIGVICASTLYSEASKITNG